MELQDQVAIVTGAGQGIGKAIARALGGHGARLALVDCNAETLAATASELRSAGVSVWTTVADVAQSADVLAMVAAAHRHYGRLDVLVNNAGIMTTGTIETCSESEWDRTLAVNLKSTFLCCQAAVPIMKAQRYGRIINMSSSASKNPPSVSGISYVASKAAVSAITGQMAYQLGPFGITCNAIAPGPIDTPMPQSSFSPDILAGLQKAIPVRRWGQPEEIGRAVLFLASPDAGFITGEILDVNGGSVID